MQRNRLRPKKIEKKTLIKVVMYYVGALSMVLIAVYAALTSMLRSFQRDLTLSAQLQYSRSVAALDDDLIAFGVSANEMYTDSDLEPEIFAEHPFSATQSTKKNRSVQSGIEYGRRSFYLLRSKPAANADWILFGRRLRRTDARAYRGIGAAISGCVEPPCQS